MINDCDSHLIPHEPDGSQIYSVGSIPLSYCREHWLRCKDVIPMFSKQRLILALENGWVVVGSFNADTQQFKTRGQYGHISICNPIAWRLFPYPPDKQQKEDIVISVKFFNANLKYEDGHND